MTRSIMVTNTSNWEGEEYRIGRIIGDGSLLETIIRPGETILIDAYRVNVPVDVQVLPVGEAKQPFYNRDGIQTYPCHRPVEWSHGPPVFENAPDTNEDEKAD